VDSRAGLDGCGKFRPPTGIGSPDRPARSQVLYRLDYPAFFFPDSHTKQKITFFGCYKKVVHLAVQPFKSRIKSHLLFAGIIRSSPFSPR